ncbi:MAG: acetoacetate--CoA ligase [Gammaproteobacteria bacterium]
MTTPIWTPSAERIAGTTMTSFMNFVARHGDPSFSDYDDLYRWSVQHNDVFWPLICRFFDVRMRKHWDEAVVDSAQMPGAKWFPGCELNFAENLLRYDDARTALVFRDERGRREALSYHDLRARVAATAAGLSSCGVQPGDRVAAFMPNHIDTVVAMLATSSIGAVFSSCSPDFGFQGVLDRFGQIEPKVLFAVDGYQYGGKRIETLDRVRRIANAIESIERVVVVPFLDTEPPIGGIRAAVSIDDFLEDTSKLNFRPVAFDHPLYIMYSSGTTGKPKCIVHGAGGTLLQHLKELGLHTDLKSDDVIFYFTTCGWMMWNWLVSSLALGSTVVLYDGSSFHPGPDALWRIVEDEGVTVFGTSAKYTSALEKHQVQPKTFDLGRLRAMLSTGSPLAPESFDYVYRDIKTDLQLSSISGGTDIISCFALGNPVLPVYRGELQCRGLGMAVDIYDENGEPVVEQKGELVCTKPFPSMPVGFWNDPDGTRYHNAYFNRFENVWCHGDYAALTRHGGMIIYGRSDSVLNPGGVRIGTAEIYRQVEQLDEVDESVAIGQDWDDDVRVVLFVRLRDGLELDDALEAKIRRVIRDNTTPRHVPAKILSVPDIPCTISGKITELAVRNVVHGQPVENSDALANPEALKHFEDRAELKS